jgi:hypothetical protein
MLHSCHVAQPPFLFQLLRLGLKPALVCFVLAKQLFNNILLFHLRGEILVGKLVSKQKLIGCPGRDATSRLASGFQYAPRVVGKFGAEELFGEMLLQKKKKGLELVS